MPERCTGYGSRDSAGRAPGEGEDTTEDPAEVLLAHTVQGCGGPLPQLCRLSEVSESCSTGCATYASSLYQRTVFQSGYGYCWYILVLCDYATRYPEAVPLRSIDAEHVAEELIKIFARVGVPEEILMDQGSNFMSKLLSELYSLLHIHLIRTSPYHPQTDGLVERFNKMLKSMLRKAVDTEGKNWDTLIPYLLLAYGEVPQASTGVELVYGRNVLGPLDVLREAWEGSQSMDESVVSYVLATQGDGTGERGPGAGSTKAMVQQEGPPVCVSLKPEIQS